MAIVTVPAFEYPARVSSGGQTPVTLATQALASTNKYAVIFRASKTGPIHKVGFRLGTVTAATDTDVRLESVSAQFPTGVLFGTTTNGTLASGSFAANAMNMVTLTADASVTAGDLIALVVVPSGSPNYQVSHLATSFAGIQSPYVAIDTTGSYVANAAGPIAAIEYADGSYAQLQSVWPITTLNTHTLNSGSTPDEIGARFKIPIGVRICGGWSAIDLDNNADIVLYDSDGVTPLATLAVTNAGRRQTTGNSPLYWSFPTPATLLASTYYYLSVKPGASNISLYSWDMLSAAALDQLPGGQDWHYVSAKDPSGTGSWTAITTRYPIMGLLVDGINVPATGGCPIIGGSIVRSA